MLPELLLYGSTTGRWNDILMTGGQSPLGSVSSRLDLSDLGWPRCAASVVAFAVVDIVVGKKEGWRMKDCVGRLGSMFRWVVRMCLVGGATHLTQMLIGACLTGCAHRVSLSFGCPKN